MELPPNIDLEKLSEMAGGMVANTSMNENSVNDQSFQQIVSFLKTEKMSIFRYLHNKQSNQNSIFHLKVAKNARGKSKIHLQTRGSLADTSDNQEERRREPGGEGLWPE